MNGQYVGVVAMAALALTIVFLGWRTRSRGDPGSTADALGVILTIGQ